MSDALTRPVSADELRVLEALARTLAAGHTAEDVEHAIRWATLVRAGHLGEPSETHVAAFEWMRVRAGIALDAPADALARGIADFIKDNPPNPEVVRSFERALEQIAAGGDDVSRGSAEKLFGRAPLVPLDQGERPEGSLSPLAARMQNAQKPRG